MIEPGRAMYQMLGFAFLGIAGLGFVLPVLPGTPFLLLSAWFFARSSEKWHRWLLDSELFGPIIHNWEAHRCINRRTKFVAIASMIVAGGASIAFGVADDRLRLLAAALMAVGTVTVLSIKTCRADSPELADLAIPSASDSTDSSR